MEVLVQIDARDLIQDVDDGMGVTVRDAAVVFIAIPAVRLWTPYTLLPLNSSIQIVSGSFAGRPKWMN